MTNNRAAQYRPGHGHLMAQSQEAKQM